MSKINGKYKTIKELLLEVDKNIKCDDEEFKCQRCKWNKKVIDDDSICDLVSIYLADIETREFLRSIEIKTNKEEK